MPQSKVISASVFIYYRFLYSLLLDQFLEIRPKNIRTWKIFSIRVKWLLFYWVHKGNEYWCLNLQFWSQCGYCGYFCPFLFRYLSFSNKTYLITERELLDICFPPKVISFFKKDVFNIVIGSLLPASLFFVFLYNFLGFPILVFVLFCLMLNHSKLIDIPKFYPILFWLKHSHETFETNTLNTFSLQVSGCVLCFNI